MYDCIWIMFYFCAAIQAVKGGDCHDLQGGRTSGHALYQWQHNRRRIKGICIDHCPDCREELEIYFTVDVGIRQLDEESGTYNIKGALETALDVSRQRIHTLNLLQNAIYAVNTLCFWSVFMIFIMQVRIWSQTGF